MRINKETGSSGSPSFKALCAASGYRDSQQTDPRHARRHQDKDNQVIVIYQKQSRASPPSAELGMYRQSVLTESETFAGSCERT